LKNTSVSATGHAQMERAAGAEFKNHGR